MQYQRFLVSSCVGGAVAHAADAWCCAAPSFLPTTYHHYLLPPAPHTSPPTPHPYPHPTTPTRAPAAPHLSATPPRASACCPPHLFCWQGSPSRRSPEHQQQPGYLQDSWHAFHLFSFCPLPDLCTRSIHSCYSWLPCSRWAGWDGRKGWLLACWVNFAILSVDMVAVTSSCGWHMGRCACIRRILFIPAAPYQFVVPPWWLAGCWNMHTMGGHKGDTQLPARTTPPFTPGQRARTRPHTATTAHSHSFASRIATLHRIPTWQTCIPAHRTALLAFTATAALFVFHAAYSLFQPTTTWSGFAFVPASHCRAFVFALHYYVDIHIGLFRFHSLVVLWPIPW